MTRGTPKVNTFLCLFSAPHLLFLCLNPGPCVTVAAGLVCYITSGLSACAVNLHFFAYYFTKY